MNKLCVVALLISAATIFAAQPVERDGWICRTKKQDAALGDWIDGTLNQLRQSQSIAAAAQLSEGKVRTSLGKAEKAGNDLKQERDQAMIDLDHVVKKLHTAKYIFIGMWLALLGVIWLKFPLPGPLKAYALYVFVPVAIAGIGVIWKWL